jgi:hypothetical protein
MGPAGGRAAPADRPARGHVGRCDRSHRRARLVVRRHRRRRVRALDDPALRRLAGARSRFRPWAGVRRGPERRSRQSGRRGSLDRCGQLDPRAARRVGDGNLPAPGRGRPGWPVARRKAAVLHARRGRRLAPPRSARGRPRGQRDRRPVGRAGPGSVVGGLAGHPRRRARAGSARAPRPAAAVDLVAAHGTNARAQVRAAGRRGRSLVPRRARSVTGPRTRWTLGAVPLRPAGRDPGPAAHPAGYDRRGRGQAGWIGLVPVERRCDTSRGALDQR